MEEKKLNFKNEKNKFLKDIYNDYYKKIYILCFKILNNNDDALDATQETFIQVYKSIDSLKDINKFNSWINKIAISKCSYIIRKNKNIFSTNDELNYVEDDTNIPDVIICEDEKKQLIFKAINKLTLKKRVVILLYYYSELKLEDISRILEIPIGTVKSRLNSAKKDLKTYLEPNKKDFKIYGTYLPLLLLLQFDPNLKINKKYLYKYYKNKLLLYIQKITIFKKYYFSNLFIKLGILFILIPNVYTQIQKYYFKNNIIPNNSVELEILHENKDTYEEDLTPPEILGANDISIKIGDKFDISKDVYVIDNSNTPVTAYAYGYINTNFKGTYAITYVAIDKNQNKTIIKRQINVI